MASAALSLADTCPSFDEPISPELALVDPELARLLREREVGRALAELQRPRPVVVPLAARPAPVVALRSARPPEPAPVREPVLVVAPEPKRVPPSAPVALREPSPAVPSAATVALPRPGAPTSTPDTQDARRSSRRNRALAVGSASVVAAAVVVALSGQLSTQPGAGVRPLAAPAVSTPATSTPPVGVPSVAQPEPDKAPPAPPTKPVATAPTAAIEPRPEVEPRAATSKRVAGRPRQSAAPTAPKSTPAPKLTRIAWAPAKGAVGYRIELFRGAKRILVVNTAKPVFGLPATWKHEGRTIRLTRGTYRWYVWPVMKSGPAATAIVQSQLRIP